MIIWLASYPRSGNTLLRTVLKQTMGLGSYSDETMPPNVGHTDLVKESYGSLQYDSSWDAFYLQASNSKDVFLVKTHLPPRDNQPVIYVVRDGRAATDSYASFNGSFIQDANASSSILELMLGNDYYGDWTSHYRAWNARDSKKLLQVRFEDLVNADHNLLETLRVFVGFEGIVKPFENPLDKQRLESPHFFRSGNTNWHSGNQWTKELESFFIALHGDLLTELGYIDVKERDVLLAGLHETQIKFAELANKGFTARNSIRYDAYSKEKIIQQIVQQFTDNEQVIQQMEQQLADKELALQQMEQQLERERVIQLMGRKLDDNEQLIQLMKQQLEDKERVILEQSMALIGYQQAFLVLGPILPALRALRALPLLLLLRARGVLRRIARRCVSILRPRLGNLNQYAPRPLIFAASDVSVNQLTNTPKVSIVTPSFRQGDFIERTIRSVLDQQYPNLEYFVQDGGSTDNTVPVLKRYESKLSGWVSGKDGGQSQAINLGFAHTTGDIMAWLNSDDLLLPGSIAIVIDYFNKHPEVDVVYGNRLLIDENDMEIGRWLLPGHDSDVLSWVDYIPQETMFWRRRLWDKVGGKVDDSFRFAMDWDLLVRFREAGARFAHIPHFLGGFRIHEQQKTSATINEIGHQEMDRIRERWLGRVPSRKEIRKKILPFMLKHILVDVFYRIKRM